MSPRSVAWQWGDIDASEDRDGLRLAHRRAGATLWVRDGRLVRGAGYAEASRETRRDLARVGAIVRLRERGRYYIHAAGAVDPEGRAVLLAGDSGSGKSTLAYALARSGWTILGDDGVLIELAGGDRVRAHAWHEPLRVSSRLAPAFPELRAHAARAQRGDPRQRMAMHVVPARGAIVASLVFIERSERHAMVRLSPLGTLGALVRQSPWVIIGDSHAPAHLAALRRAAALPSFHLQHTPAELFTLPRVLTEAIA
jgi:hypothetical protein